jgi:hypothetical protein
VPEQRARSQFFHSNILPVAAECGKYSFLVHDSLPGREMHFEPAKRQI